MTKELGRAREGEDAVQRQAHGFAVFASVSCGGANVRVPIASPTRLIFSPLSKRCEQNAWRKQWGVMWLRIPPRLLASATARFRTSGPMHHRVGYAFGFETAFRDSTAKG